MMTDKKISALPAATTPLAGTEVLPIVQGGVTDKVSVANLTAGRAVSADSLALTGSPLPATSGGTGQSSYAVGDLLYASTTTALSKLADVATGNALISGGVGVAPSWGKVGLTTHVSGTLAVGNGGTGLSTVAQGDLLYGSASNTLSALAKNTTATRYLSNTGTSNNPAWAQVDLTNGVTGTLPVANGGTGLSSLTANRVLYASATNTVGTSSNFTFDGTNFFVGTSTQYTNSVANFYKTATGANQRVASFVNDGSAGAGTTAAGIYIYYPNAASGNGSTFITCSDSNADRFYVLGNGDCQNTNNSYGGISDEKLKQDIVDAGSQWNDVKNLRVRKYRFKSDPTGSLHLGMIAQETEITSPGLVEEIADEDKEGNFLGTTTKSIKYSVAYMKAFKALQEAMERIEQLENKVAALEGKS